MIPEFERQLEGKQGGEKFSFGIKSADAYGEHDPDAIVSLPKSTFVIDGRLAEEFLVPGKVIPMSDQHGNRLNGTVRDVRGEEVIVDFNHPMAGHDLHFSGNVESVRQATPSEIEHGHVHGPDGHHH
jgi:FKBP-type peptidyl-prolyl cis-trans isomerase SlyD